MGWKQFLMALGGAVGAGALGAAVYWEIEAHRSRKVLAVGLDMTLDQLRAALPAEGQPYTSVIFQAAQETGVSPLILAGVLWREGDFGTKLTPPGPAGTGDFAPRAWTKNVDGSAMPMPPDGKGWGRGLGQHDWYFDRDWLAANDWTDPYQNIRRIADKLIARAQHYAVRGLSDAQLLKATVASYNANEAKVLSAVRANADPDSVTTGKNYAADVLAHAASYASAAGVPAPGSLTTAVA
jgi:hypothetical protein